MIVLPIVVAGFLLFDRASRVASRQFLGRVWARDAGLLEVARHLYTFASVSLDRLLLMDGGERQLDVELINTECFDVLDGGAVLVTSHFGSFDVMRVLAHSRQAMPVHILLDVAHNARAMGVLNALDPELAARVVDAGQPGPSLILELKALLEGEHLVGMMADRTPPGQRSATVPFLGAEAAFPLGPWLLAAILRQPVILCFGAFLGGNRYRVKFERVDMQTTGRNKARAQAGMQYYVDRLEHQVTRAPYNWFNFYDFWSNEEVRREHL